MYIVPVTKLAKLCLYSERKRSGEQMEQNTVLVCPFVFGGARLESK